MKNIVILLIVLVLASGCSSTKNIQPKEVDLALDNAESITLYSLEPWSNPEENNEKLHHVKVLGKVALNKEQFAPVINVFRQAVINAKVNPSEYAVSCHDPRQAIRVIYKNNTYDLLICFACINMQIFKNNESIAWKTIQGSPDLLNDILQKNGIQLSNTQL